MKSGIAMTLNVTMLLKLLSLVPLVLSIVNSEHILSSECFLGSLTVSPWPHLAHLSGQLPQAAPTCHEIQGNRRLRNAIF